MLVAVAGGLQKGVLAQIVPVLCPGAGREQRQAGVSQQEGCFPSVGEDRWEERDKSCGWEVVLGREGRGLSWPRSCRMRIPVQLGNWSGGKGLSVFLGINTSVPQEKGTWATG